MPNERIQRGYLTQRLGNAIHSGEHSLANVPGLLKQALETQAWKDRLVVETGEEIEGFPTFEEYVSAYPPKGLGATMDLIKRLIDQETRDLLDRLEQRSKGKPVGSVPHDDNIAVNGLTQPNNGYIKNKKKRDRSGRVLRQLRKNAPELHQQVLNGSKSPYAAATEAKVYPKRIAVNLTNAKSAYNTLMNNASPEFLEELIQLFLNGGKE